MKRSTYLIASLSALLICFTSCKIGRGYQSPALPGMPEQFASLNEQAGSVDDIGWSSLYQDTVLQGLIDKALDNNKDLLIAAAKIKEMIANKRIKFAPLLPELGLEAGGQKEMLNYGGDAEKYSPEFRANLNVSWELDVWGNLRWQNEAGVAAYMQSVEAQRALRLTIISQVAQAYFELKALDRQLQIVKQTLEARKEGVKFAKLRYEGGLTSEIPYRQSLVELARTETLVPDIANKIKLKENDLAVLVGDYPSTLIPRGQSIYEIVIPQDLPVDLPSELLKRRPDVRMAEQSLIEKNAQAGAALSDMFPKLRLTGRYGREHSELTNFLESPTWFLSSFLAGPVFNFGKNKAKHKAAKAAFEAEAYQYEKTVLNVFREVNNAITSLQQAKDMRESQRKLYESARTYRRLAQLQYVNGVVRYLDVLDAQRQLFDAEMALNNAYLNELTGTVNLYKALGGGLSR